MGRRDPTGGPGTACRDSEAAVYADRARRLGLPFAPTVHLGAGALADLAAIRRGAFALSPEGDRLAFAAPDEDAMPAVRGWLHCHPEVRFRLRVSTPAAIRAALIEAGSEQFADDAVHHLAILHPDLSARRIATAAQIAVALVVAAAVVLALAADPAAALVALNLVGAAFFFGVSVLRFIAAGFTGAAPGPIASPPSRVSDAELPVYTVLVPLYHEASVVADLVAALDKLDWPGDRLDIKIILEADDTATIAAARAACGDRQYEIILVPPIGPRTKPKALSFALPFARGAFVTVYDAEDRPHPAQLREAFAAFGRAGDDLACLQSALVVDNGGDGWLARLFAIEYAALFDGLLPALAALGMPLPLGGTSNHFRRAALDAVGGWDPFNVTEDADLGLRLARLGYRAGTLALPTLEEAPAAFRPWLYQRTRWFKGWMQTWLVHSRHPVRLARQLGPGGLLGFGLVCTGVIVSALVYPLCLLALVTCAMDPFDLWGSDSVLSSMVLGVNLFNLVAGYIAMAVLGGRSLDVRGRAGEASGLMLLPFYWMLTSLAAYRAILHLVLRPFDWEKTPHSRRPKAGPDVGAGASGPNG